MKKIGIFFIVLISAWTLNAQSSINYTPENEGWMIDLDKAFEESKKTGKPIMANFTGSDWCGWCKRLTKNVFSKDDFKSWADENVVLLELDFPRRKQLPQELKKQNYGLQKAFKITGYPTVWLFDLSKDQNTGQYNINALGKTGYAKSVEDFTTGVDKMIARREQAGS